MKIEQLLVQHFYNNRAITLQGMGTFELSPDFILPLENDKEIAIPENAIRFHYNPKATEDESLIDFIVQQTRKIKPLASADLDSYLVLGKQFINIGKPFKIEGVGILEKNMQGDLDFSQGHYTSSKMEAAPVALKEKSEEDISFAATRVRSGDGGKKALIIGVSVLLLALIGWGAWYVMNRKKNNSVSQNTEQNIVVPPVVKDTVQSLPPKKDSIIAPAVASSNPYNYSFRVVFRESIDEAGSITKMKELIARGHKVIMLTTDSVLYKLAEPYKLPLSDTARIRDSLNKYYYLGKGYVEVY